MSKKRSSIPVEQIERSILWIRGHRVMIDSGLAALYGVETRVLIQAVKRNLDRFPTDFMFQLTQGEFDNLRSQLVISKHWGGRRYPQLAELEQKIEKHDTSIRSILEAIRQLMTLPKEQHRPIGFHSEREIKIKE
jgi:hypothetical protein